MSIALPSTFDAPTRKRGTTAGKPQLGPPPDTNTWRRTDAGKWRPGGWTDEPALGARTDVPHPTGAAGHDDEWATHLAAVTDAST